MDQLDGPVVPCHARLPSTYHETATPVPEPLFTLTCARYWLSLPAVADTGPESWTAATPVVKAVEVAEVVEVVEVVEVAVTVVVVQEPEHKVKTVLLTLPAVK